MEKIRLLLFDLDGTLLRNDKIISAFTLRVLHECREKGILIGVSTSRSEKNSMKFINELNPDIVISSAGALAKYNGTYIYKAEFTEKETAEIIRIIRQICGILAEEIMSFGDDYADIGMLKLCGKGIAMGNAIEEVKSVSDIIIGDNDGDGIAHYLTEILF